MREVIRMLLDVRDKLDEVYQRLEGLTESDSTPELDEMRRLERILFEKIIEWEKP